VGPTAGLDAVETRQILPMQEAEPRPSNPWPVAIPTELSRLPNRFINVTVISGGNGEAGSDSNIPDLSQGALGSNLDRDIEYAEIGAFSEPVQTNT
jgi:hypothetical protein